MDQVVQSRERWDEDLQLQAVRGESTGRALCICADHYHVSWSVLRAAGFRNTLTREEPLLGPLLSRVIRDGMRILLSIPDYSGGSIELPRTG